MTMTTSAISNKIFVVGQKVKIKHPGHCCSRFDSAVIVALEAIANPELVVIKFENGLIANCDKERLERD